MDAVGSKVPHHIEMSISSCLVSAVAGAVDAVNSQVSNDFQMGPCSAARSAPSDVQ